MKLGSFKPKANKVMRNLLSQILINCPKGCKQIIKYENFQSHMKNCEDSAICKECTTKIPDVHNKHINEEIQDLHNKLEELKIKNLECQDNMIKEKRSVEDLESEKKNLICELKEYKLRFLAKVEEAENEKKNAQNLKLEIDILKQEIQEQVKKEVIQEVGRNETIKEKEKEIINSSKKIKNDEIYIFNGFLGSNIFI